MRLYWSWLLLGAGALAAACADLATLARQGGPTPAPTFAPIATPTPTAGVGSVATASPFSLAAALIHWESGGMLFFQGLDGTAFYSTDGARTFKPITGDFKGFPLATGPVSDGTSVWLLYHVDDDKPNAPRVVASRFEAGNWVPDAAGLPARAGIRSSASSGGHAFVQVRPEPPYYEHGDVYGHAQSGWYRIATGNSPGGRPIQIEAAHGPLLYGIETFSGGVQAYRLDAATASPTWQPVGDAIYRADSIPLFKYRQELTATADRLFLDLDQEFYTLDLASASAKWQREPDMAGLMPSKLGPDLFAILDSFDIFVAKTDPPQKLLRFKSDGTWEDWGPPAEGQMSGLVYVGGELLTRVSKAGDWTYRPILRKAAGDRTHSGWKKAESP